MKLRIHTIMQKCKYWRNLGILTNIAPILVNNIVCQYWRNIISQYWRNIVNQY